MATSSSNARKRQAPDQPAAADSPARRKRKPSKFKHFLRIVLLVLIIIAASVGATLYYTWPAGASLLSFIPQSSTTDTEPSDILPPEAPEPAPVLPPEKPIFVRLEPFTVTISEGGSRSRILHVAITLRVADDKSSALIGEYMPMVRDQVLQILSAQHPQYIQTPEGREQLVASLKHALSQPYDAKSSGPDITHVLFTAFVIQ